MSGLLFYAALGLWLWLVFIVSRWIGRRVSAPRWQTPATAAAFCLLLVLPVADEIVSRHRFETLCKERMKLDVDAEKIRGRTVVHTFKQYYVRAIAIQVLQSDSTYADKDSGEVLATLTWLRAKGGWLSRTLPGGGNPFTFMDSYECIPKLERRIEETYQFTLINN
jgi:hypothetical protein